MAEATVATQFETLTAAAQGCDIIVAATALQIAARSVAEKMGIPYVFAAYSPTVLPSPHHPPPPLPPLPGQTPPSTNDNGELWARNATRFHDLFGPALNATAHHWRLSRTCAVTCSSTALARRGSDPRAMARSLRRECSRQAPGYCRTKSAVSRVGNVPER
jgi:hypothetical protein